MGALKTAPVSGHDGQPLLRLNDDPTEKGKAAVSQADAESLERLTARLLLTGAQAFRHTPSGLAAYLAAVDTFFCARKSRPHSTSPGSAVELSGQWMAAILLSRIPDNRKFADAYAQTVTYALLLARLSGAAKLDNGRTPPPSSTRITACSRATLELLGQPKPPRKELSVGFALLARSLEALDPHDFNEVQARFVGLYFYEDFLAALRSENCAGITASITRRAKSWNCRCVWRRNCWEKRFGKKLGFADDGGGLPSIRRWAPALIRLRRSSMVWTRVRERSGPAAPCRRAPARWPRTCTVSRCWSGLMRSRICA